MNESAAGSHPPLPNPRNEGISLSVPLAGGSLSGRPPGQALRQRPLFFTALCWPIDHGDAFFFLFFFSCVVDPPLLRMRKRLFAQQETWSSWYCGPAELSRRTKRKKTTRTEVSDKNKPRDSQMFCGWCLQCKLGAASVAQMDQSVPEETSLFSGAQGLSPAKTPPENGR